ncbi:MAG: PIN domain-containing protein [Oscillospiraceae bacterium]|jgi:predicted nucleic acid-binding protein|nr:PIN domain-containing protein [Oscillospiraceae bacterium]
MTKLKIYLDTSAISCLDAPETPERMIQTQMFWDTAKRGEYELVVSNITLDEMNACPEPKRSFMRLKLAEIPYLTRVDDSGEAKALARLYLDEGGLPPASTNDAIHLAVATLEKCDCVASWNLKHMANIRAKSAVAAVNSREGHSPLEIWTPPSLIIDKEDEMQ